MEQQPAAAPPQQLLKNKPLAQIKKDLFNPSSSASLVEECVLHVQNLLIVSIKNNNVADFVKQLVVEVLLVKETSAGVRTIWIKNALRRILTSKTPMIINFCFDAFSFSGGAFSKDEMKRVKDETIVSFFQVLNEEKLDATMEENLPLLLHWLKTSIVRGDFVLVDVKPFFPQLVKSLFTLCEKIKTFKSLDFVGKVTLFEIIADLFLKPMPEGLSVLCWTEKVLLKSGDLFAITSVETLCFSALYYLACRDGQLSEAVGNTFAEKQENDQQQYIYTIQEDVDFHLQMYSLVLERCFISAKAINNNNSNIEFTVGTILKKSKKVIEQFKGVNSNLIKFYKMLPQLMGMHEELLFGLVFDISNRALLFSNQNMKSTCDKILLTMDANKTKTLCLNEIKSCLALLKSLSSSPPLGEFPLGGGKDMYECDDLELLISYDLSWVLKKPSDKEAAEDETFVGEILSLVALLENDLPTYPSIFYSFLVLLRKQNLNEEKPIYHAVERVCKENVTHLTTNPVLCECKKELELDWNINIFSSGGGGVMENNEEENNNSKVAVIKIPDFLEVLFACLNDALPLTKRAFHLLCVYNECILETRFSASTASYGVEKKNSLPELTENDLNWLAQQLAKQLVLNSMKSPAGSAKETFQFVFDSLSSNQNNNNNLTPQEMLDLLAIEKLKLKFVWGLEKEIVNMGSTHEKYSFYLKNKNVCESWLLRLDYEAMKLASRVSFNSAHSSMIWFASKVLLGGNSNNNNVDMGKTVQAECCLVDGFLNHPEKESFNAFTILSQWNEETFLGNLGEDTIFSPSFQSYLRGCDQYSRGSYVQAGQSFEESLRIVASSRTDNNQPLLLGAQFMDSCARWSVQSLVNLGDWASLFSWRLELSDIQSKVWSKQEDAGSAGEALLAMGDALGVYCYNREFASRLVWRFNQKQDSVEEEKIITIKDLSWGSGVGFDLRDRFHHYVMKKILNREPRAREEEKKHVDAMEKFFMTCSGEASVFKSNVRKLRCLYDLVEVIPGGGWDEETWALGGLVNHNLSYSQAAVNTRVGMIEKCLLNNDDVTAVKLFSGFAQKLEPALSEQILGIAKQLHRMNLTSVLNRYVSPQAQRLVLAPSTNEWYNLGLFHASLGAFKEALKAHVEYLKTSPPTNAHTRGALLVSYLTNMFSEEKEKQVEDEAIQCFQQIPACYLIPMLPHMLGRVEVNGSLKRIVQGFLSHLIFTKPSEVVWSLIANAGKVGYSNLEMEKNCPSVYLQCNQFVQMLKNLSVLYLEIWEATLGEALQFLREDETDDFLEPFRSLEGKKLFFKPFLRLFEHAYSITFENVNINSSLCSLDQAFVESSTGKKLVQFYLDLKRECEALERVVFFNRSSLVNSLKEMESEIIAMKRYYVRVDQVLSSSQPITFTDVELNGETVKKLANHVEILKTKTKPRRVWFETSSSSSSSYLLKSSEDLNLDQRLVLLWNLINENLNGRSLISSYCVVPIGSRIGLIEWVDASLPMYRYYKDWKRGVNTHGNNGNEVDEFRECLLANNNDRLKTFKEMREKYAPESKLLHRVIYSLSDSVESYQFRVNAFTKSYGASCAMTWLLGLGDRHLDNILLNVSNGKVTHVDLNVCFDKGISLKVPETVPFRLTDLVLKSFSMFDFAAVGAAKNFDYGLFNHSFKHCLVGVNKCKVEILASLETFIYDPIKNRKNEHTLRIDSNLKRIFYLSKISNVLSSLDDIEVDETLLDAEVQLAGGSMVTTSQVQGKGSALEMNKLELKKCLIECQTNQYDMMECFRKITAFHSTNLGVATTTDNKPGPLKLFSEVETVTLAGELKTIGGVSKQVIETCEKVEGAIMENETGCVGFMEARLVPACKAIVYLYSNFQAIPLPSALLINLLNQTVNEMEDKVYLNDRAGFFSRVKTSLGKIEATIKEKQVSLNDSVGLDDLVRFKREVSTAHGFIVGNENVWKRKTPSNRSSKLERAVRRIQESLSVADALIGLVSNLSTSKDLAGEKAMGQLRKLVLLQQSEQMAAEYVPKIKHVLTALLLNNNTPYLDPATRQNLQTCLEYFSKDLNEEASIRAFAFKNTWVYLKSVHASLRSDLNRILEEEKATPANEFFGEGEEKEEEVLSSAKRSELAAVRANSRVKQRLDWCAADNGHLDGLVKQLIAQARDDGKLSAMFEGWMAWI